MTITGFMYNFTRFGHQFDQNVLRPRVKLQTEISNIH